jgi:uroporphyrin-III C-methyltransferase/precorrin-2 dehydrogenase/sirohydrochlorin ferrochelatase
MEYLPIFLKLEDRLAVLVGGGTVAARKLDLLRRAGARVRIVAPALADEIAKLAATGRIEYRPREFRTEDLDGAELVIAATDRPSVNRAVAEAARARHLPVNVVDAPDLCSFIMPAIIDRGRVVAAVSTGGASPVLARLIRARIEQALPHGIERLAELAAAWRDRVKAALPAGLPRQRFWESLFASGSAERILAGEAPDLSLLLASAEPPRGRLQVIEVAPQDPEALTLRAVRLLQSADLVLHDPGIAPEILDYARRDARRVEVEKPGRAIPPEAVSAIAAGELIIMLEAQARSRLSLAYATARHRRAERPEHEQRIAALSRDTPLGRFGRAGEVAAVAVLLASDEAGFMTGAELGIDGGMTAGTLPIAASGR